MTSTICRTLWCRMFLLTLNVLGIEERQQARAHMACIRERERQRDRETVPRSSDGWGVGGCIGVIEKQAQTHTIPHPSGRWLSCLMRSSLGYESGNKMDSLLADDVVISESMMVFQLFAAKYQTLLAH